MQQSQHAYREQFVFNLTTVNRHAAEGSYLVAIGGTKIDPPMLIERAYVTNRQAGGPILHITVWTASGERTAGHMVEFYGSDFTCLHLDCSKCGEPLDSPMHDLDYATLLDGMREANRQIGNYVEGSQAQFQFVRDELKPIVDFVAAHMVN